MKLFDAFALLITMSAFFGYINHRFLRMPSTIGMMLLSLIASLGIILAGNAHLPIYNMASEMLTQFNFSEILMDIMLCFLLFAGALHTDVKTLASQRIPIFLFATLGVVVSTFIIAALTFYTLQLLGFAVPFIHCLLFGSIISPTDPIAVLAILKKAQVPKTLEVKIAGESLFNDGIAVVVFISLFKIAQTGVENVSATDITLLFVTEAIGGAVWGLLLGYVGYWLLRSINNYVIELLITLAMVTGGYWIAQMLHISGPLAIVIAGLVTSDRARIFAMSDTTREYIDMFWEMVDEVLNAILFVFIGLEFLVIKTEPNYVTAGIIAFVIVLLARFISVGLPIKVMKMKQTFLPNTIAILTWGGLRGGISIALALSLTPDMSRDILVSITYCVVILSITIQGLTVEKLVKRLRIRTVPN